MYKVVAQKLASKEKFNEVKVLLSNAIQTRLMNEKDHDAVLLDLLGLLTDDDRKVRFASLYSNLPGAELFNVLLKPIQLLQNYLFYVDRS